LGKKTNGCFNYKNFPIYKGFEKQGFKAKQWFNFSKIGNYVTALKLRYQLKDQEQYIPK